MKRKSVIILICTLCVMFLFTAVSCENSSQKELLSEVLTDMVAAEGYTKASYEVYAAAYEKAKDVYENKNATALEIDRAVEELKKAKDALVRTADFSQLKLAIDASVGVDASLYTQQTYETFLAALNKAKEVFAKDTSKQSEINSAVTSLQNAKEGLIKIPNNSSLQVLLQNHIDSSPYTGASYKIYEDAYKSAQMLVQSGSASQSDLLLAENLLKQAISALVTKGDTAALQALLIEIEEQYLGLDEKNRKPDERYAASGYSAFMEIFEKAKNAVRTGDVSSEEVTVLLAEVKDSPAMLVDIGSLLDRIDLLGIYSEERHIYTEESYESLLNAVSSGIVVVKDGNSTKEQIEESVRAIDEAIELLEKRELVPDYMKDKPLLDKLVVVGNSSMVLSDYFKDYVSFFSMVERENINFAYGFVDDNSVEFSALNTKILMSEKRLKFTYVGTGPVAGEDAMLISFGGLGFSNTEFDVSAESKLGTPTDYSKRTEMIFGEEHTICILSYENEDEGIKVIFEYNASGNYISSIEILQII